MVHVQLPRCMRMVQIAGRCGGHRLPSGKVKHTVCLLGAPACLLPSRTALASVADAIVHAFAAVAGLQGVGARVSPTSAGHRAAAR